MPCHVKPAVLEITGTGITIEITKGANAPARITIKQVVGNDHSVATIDLPTQDLEKLLDFLENLNI